MSYNLTSSQEDYLEAVYCEVLKNGSAKVTDISKILNVKKSSVSEALTVLSEKKLVNYAPYQVITLTQAGKILAKQILEKHECVLNFFVDVLGIDKKEALVSACKIEHAMTNSVFEKMILFSEFIHNYSKENIDFEKKLKSSLKLK